MSLTTVLRRSLALGLAVATVAVLWTLAVLWSVRTDLTDARTTLQGLSSAPDVRAAAQSLDRARADLQRTADRLAQPGPSMVAAVPVLGRTVTAVSRTTDAALAVVDGTTGVLSALDDGRPLLSGGTVDLATLSRVDRALTRAAARSDGPVAALDNQSLGMVPGPVRGPVQQARDLLTGAPGSFERAAAGLGALSGVLGAGGPRSLLVVLQNNAELRGSGGLVTVFAVATAEAGRLTMGPFRDVEEVAATPADAVQVPAPEDYRQLWGPFLANSTLWKNTNMTPDVPTASAVLARVAETSLGRRPDAVLWFDVPAISAVLNGIGPVTLPDASQLTGANAVERLLSQAYQDAPDTPTGQAQRRAALRGAADAVLGRLLRAQTAPSVLALGPALIRAAGGRHIAVWSDRAQEELTLQRAGLAGQVAAAGGDLSSVAVQNLGGGDREGNKLDYYARRSVSVRVTVSDRQAIVEQDIVLRNTAPATGLPAYVAGRVAPGTTNNLLTMALPTTATQVEVSRGGRLLAAAAQPDGDHAEIVDAVSLPAGTQATWRLRYRVPVTNGRYDITVVPQPLAFDATLRLEVRALEGARLVLPPGSALAVDRSGAARLEAPFDGQQRLSVGVQQQSWLTRAVAAVRRFWREPVRLRATGATLNCRCA